MAGRTVTRTARETIVAILTRNDAEWIAIFGSYARGSAGPASDAPPSGSGAGAPVGATSDIDILVRFA
jgi:predicted nucleotidyltransferase